MFYQNWEFSAAPKRCLWHYVTVSSPDIVCIRPTVTNCAFPSLKKVQFVTALGIKMWVQNTPRQDEGGILTGSNSIIPDNQCCASPKWRRYTFPDRAMRLRDVFCTMFRAYILTSYKGQKKYLAQGAVPGSGDCGGSTYARGLGNPRKWTGERCQT
jgi:hypothetical protein